MIRRAYRPCHDWQVLDSSVLCVIDYQFATHTFLNENPAVDASRTRVPAAYLTYQVTALVCQATGGPCQYGGRGMLESHAELYITEEEWDRMVVLFVGVLTKYEVPEAETQELLAIIDSTKADIVIADAQ